MSKIVELITDGAAPSNTRNRITPGGWCAIIWEDNHGDVSSFVEAGGELLKDTTGAKMELTALVQGLDLIVAHYPNPNDKTRPSLLKIISDYEPLVNGVNLYLDGWRKLGFRRLNRKKLEHEVLWRQIDSSLTKLREAGTRVEAEWLRAHCSENDPRNHVADTRAKAEAQKQRTNHATSQ